MSQKIKTSVEIDGSLSASQIANATTDTDKFLVSDGGTVKYRTGLEVLSDLGISFGTASKIQHQVKAGVAINKGQAVYVTGADGTNMIVGLASNASEGTSSKTMGLLNNTVAINGFADVITEGLLDGLNTIGATVGDPVWLGTGGNLIYGLVNKPYAPNHLVFIGIVTRVNANNGEIFVKVQNGFELEELHNVLLSNLQNKQLLTYNTSNSLWENKSIGTVLGGTSDQYVKGDGSFSSAMNSRIEVNFVATAGQTTFNTPYEVGQVDVYYNGSKLYPNEFTATDRYSIVLAVGASLNAQISIVKYVSTFSTTAIRNEAIFTTTSGQTTFSVNYAVGQVDVFYNGSKLNTSEFTATDGTSVVLGFACASGESIAIISYVNQVSGANGTSNKVAKFTGTATLGDSQIDDNGTNVSIGHTTNPNVYKLDVNGNGRFQGLLSGDVGFLAGVNNSGSARGYSTNYQNNANSRSWRMIGEQVAYGDFDIQQSTTQTGTSYASKLYINPYGNIGFGTTVPTNSLTLVSSNSGRGIDFVSYANNSNVIGQIDFNQTTDTFAIYNKTGVGNLSFGTNNSERVRISSVGNVYIGPTPINSSVKLKVEDSGTSSVLSLNTTDTTGRTTIDLITNGYDWEIGARGSSNSPANSFYIYNIDNSAYRFVISPSGNVLIGGQTDGGYKLDVDGYAAVKSGGYGGGGYVIKSYPTGASRNWGIFNDQLLFGDFCINTSSTQTGSPGTTRLYINPSGFVGIGGTTTVGRPLVVDSTNGGTVRFHNGNNVNGNVTLSMELGGSNTNNTSSYYLYCDTDNVGVRMVVYGNGNVSNVNNSYGAYSDVKLKENIVDTTPKLDDLLKVKIRNYNLIGDDKKQIGVVAQELEEVFPGLIEESEDLIKDEETGENTPTGETTKSVKYSVFVPILVKAMQELAEQVQELKAEIEILKNK